MVILAVFVITSLIKGFFKQIFKIAVTIGAFLIAYFFCDNLSNFLENKFQLLTKLSDKIVTLFDVPAEALKGNIEETIVSAVESMNLPQFIAEAAVKSLGSLSNTIDNSIIGVQTHIAGTLANYILIGASFIGLLIVSRLLLSIVSMILSKLVELPIIKSIDKILGGVMGLFGGFVVLTVLIYLISVIHGDLFNTVRESNSFMYEFLHKYNFIEAIISAIVSKF